eukprot:407358-Rhodomonas_salina.4
MVIGHSLARSGLVVHMFVSCAGCHTEREIRLSSVQANLQRCARVVSHTTSTEMSQQRSGGSFLSVARYCWEWVED